jgi:DNA invertase Pin-like site-specific DNA recombinase
MGHLLGYARVSTTDQHPQLQVDALKAAGCYRVFVETASGARSDRPTLAQVLDQLPPGDTLVVWKLDRLGRSLRHLVDTVTGLADRGVGFRSLQEAIDTTTPGGKLVFHVFAALAEFERDLIRERTSAGLAAARVRGRHGGSPPVITAHKLQVAREMYRSRQYTVSAIATTLGVSRASIYRHLDITGYHCGGQIGWFIGRRSRCAGAERTGPPPLAGAADDADRTEAPW